MVGPLHPARLAVDKLDQTTLPRWIGYGEKILIALVIALLLSLILPVLRPKARPIGDGAVSTQLGRLISRRTRGVAVAVIDLNDAVPVRYSFVRTDNGTRFEYGSISKAMTGLLLADSIDRGEVELDSDLGEFLHELRGTPVGSTTLAELATHTSGLPRILNARGLGLKMFLGQNPYAKGGPLDLIRGCTHLRLQNRGKSNYSNLGTALLGHALARAAGSSGYASLLRDRIAAETGMATAVIPASFGAAPRGWSPIGFRRGAWVMNGYAPAGGVVGTIEDLTHLAVSMLRGEAPGLEAVAPLVSEENRLGNNEPGVQTSIGMFWRTELVLRSGREMIWHNGCTGGYSSFLSLFPQAQRGVVVLANVARPAEQQRIALGLARWLVEADTKHARH